MELQQAQSIADKIIETLKPYCKRRGDGDNFYIEVAGSVRRKKPIVKDIDLVLIPSDPWILRQTVGGLGASRASGAKLQRINHNGVQIDLYFATEETWATLLLIRTGSVQNNIRLCSIAKKKGWHLAAAGQR